MPHQILKPGYGPGPALAKMEAYESVKNTFIMADNRALFWINILNIQVGKQSYETIIYVTNSWYLRCFERSFAYAFMNSHRSNSNCSFARRETKLNIWLAADPALSFVSFWCSRAKSWSSGNDTIPFPSRSATCKLQTNIVTSQKALLCFVCICKQE